MFVIIIAVLIAVVIIASIVIAIYRNSLRKKSELLVDVINNITPYYINIASDLESIDLPQSPDIVKDLNKSFGDGYITMTQSYEFCEYYRVYYTQAKELVRKQKRYRVIPDDAIINFIESVESINNIIRKRNDKYINYQLSSNSLFFDTCLSYPLDYQQRRSIVSEEDNCLVLSSAGSGKTSSIVGKVKYLTQKLGILPQRILLISYTNKAAAELSERLSSTGLEGYTFHKLALNIIGKATGTKPSICDNTDALFIEAHRILSEQAEYKRSVLDYFANYQIEESDAELAIREERAQLSECKRAQIKAMFSDMDGRSIFVRSEQESKLCFALSTLGVRFRYEEPYEHKVSDATHSQYKPDFSIYYTKNGKLNRVYLEHFGINEKGLVPSWFAKDKGISYEEANKKYNDGIAWKRAAHEKYGTTLITTSSADFSDGDIRSKLKLLLEQAGVPIIERSDDELYSLVVPEGSNREKAFIRLSATFVSLLKTSCKSPSVVVRQVADSGDRRSRYIIENIFLPVYEQYTRLLKSRDQIDFTDAIIWATDICNQDHLLEYDYIIVDEFQDISIDRYNFLKALRGVERPARLYCVGDDWQSIYRFSGSDMALFNQFPEYFGLTEINRIETTYRFGEPTVSLSAQFIQRNGIQFKKNIHPYSDKIRTDLEFYAYRKEGYGTLVRNLVDRIPSDKSIFLLGRYSFDDILLSHTFKSQKEGNQFFYFINDRKIEFITAHKSKGLEADYVIILQCNKDVYGFPSLINDDPALNYVLTCGDQFPFGEERRLFYVAITRAKIKTMILYDNNFPSVFVDEFLHPEVITRQSYEKHRNAQKRWTRKEDEFLLKLHSEGKTIKFISNKMGRSQTSIIMRLGKLENNY